MHISSDLSIQLSVMCISAIMVVRGVKKHSILGVEFIPLVMAVWLSWNGDAGIALLVAVLLILPFVTSKLDVFNIAIRKLLLGRNHPSEPKSTSHMGELS